MHVWMVVLACGRIFYECEEGVEIWRWEEGLLRAGFRVGYLVFFEWAAVGVGWLGAFILGRGRVVEVRERR